MADMTISLSAEQEQFVRGLIASGRYDSASEAVQAALELLEQDEQERLLEKWLRDELTPAEEARLNPDLRKQAEDQMRQLSERAEADVEAGRVCPAEQVRQRLLERLRGPKQARRAS